VWSQPDDGKYKVFYNAWLPPEQIQPLNAIQISLNDEAPVHAILPKIETMPYSADLEEAVICWGVTPSTGAWTPDDVVMVVTPFIGPEYEDYEHQIGGVGVAANRCPDIAPYQGYYEEFEGQGLIVLSRQADIWEVTDDWDIVASAYSVQVDYGEETFDFNLEQYTYVPCVPQWNPDNPFTGPTICLRNPDPSGWDEDVFGMAWVVQGYTAYYAEGDTTDD
jgi:hypothetical protein